MLRTGPAARTAQLPHKLGGLYRTGPGSQRYHLSAHACSPDVPYERVAARRDAGFEATAPDTEVVASLPSTPPLGPSAHSFTSPVPQGASLALPAGTGMPPHGLWLFLTNAQRELLVTAPASGPGLTSPRGADAAALPAGLPALKARSWEPPLRKAAGGLPCAPA